jgi:hypothetical protein
MYVCLFAGAPRIDRDFRQLSSEPSSVVHWPGGRGRPDNGLGHGFAIGGCIEMVAITCVLVAAVFVPYTRAPEMAGKKIKIDATILISAAYECNCAYMYSRMYFILTYVHTRIQFQSNHVTYMQIYLSYRRFDVIILIHNYCTAKFFFFFL